MGSDRHEGHDWNSRDGIYAVIGLLFLRQWKT
jgi:hypothetical protein